MPNYYKLAIAPMVSIYTQQKARLFFNKGEHPSTETSAVKSDNDDDGFLTIVTLLRVQ